MWGVQPSEFWRMTLREFWCVYDAKVGEPKYGSLRESEVAELYDRMKAAQKAQRDKHG